MRLALPAVLALSWLTPPDLSAQVQFLATPRREPESLLPFADYQGYAVVGDIDRDGRNDIVATFRSLPGPPKASVFLASATGFLATQNSLQWAGQRPLLVDLEGDGDLDLAFVPPRLGLPSAVLLYQNTPAGMIPATLPAAMAGVAVPGTAVGDIDGDGFADLVVAVPLGSVVPSLVLARGGPGLQFTLDMTSMPVGLPLGLTPELLDADGDGDLDVIATAAGSGLLFLRNVGGAFVDASGSLPSGRSGFTGLKSADLDGDGRSDCAAVLATGDIDVLWCAPGGFTYAVAVATVPGVRGLYAADFDGDSDLDLLAEHDSGLDVLWNQGLRQFTRASLVGEPTGLRGTGDVDGDGIADVVYATSADPAVVRCRWRASVDEATFAVGIPPPPAAALPHGASAVGDVDGDGRTDIVTVGALATTVDHALGGGTYRRSSSALQIPRDYHDHRHALADMDGDGDLDFVVKTDSRLTVEANDGTGTFTATLQSPSASPSSFDDLHVADMDADGLPDIVHIDSSGVLLVRNLGGGLYAAPVVIVPPLNPPRCIEVADVDSDGDLDVVTDVMASSGLTHVIAANDGRGNLAPDVRFYVDVGPSPTAVEAGDLDADGDADLVVVDVIVRVYRNLGGYFLDRTAFDVPPGTGPILANVVVADLDDDGDLDVAATRSGSVPLLLLNDGSGRFVDRSASRFGSQFVNRDMHAADFDDDGDLDLVCSAGFPVFLTNHLRQCRSNAPLRLGGLVSVDLISGPGFGQPGVAALGVALAPTAAPLLLPGMAGQLDLDPASLQILALAVTSPIGVSSVFAPVPQQPSLFGIEVWFQGAILPAIGQPGFTNSIYQVVL